MISNGMILFWLSVAALLLALLGCVYLVAAAILVGRFARRRASAAPSSMPRVTILKPLHGDEPALRDNLASFCGQDYPGPVQIIFGVQDPNDQAIATVRRLREDDPARDIDLVVDGTMHGSNRKVSNLVNMTRRIRHEVIVLADSDMRVGPDYLRRIIAALEEPGVGGVTCLYHGIAASGLASRLSALGIDAHFLPGVVVGLALGLARPCFGSTIALRCETLAEIGGFAAFADCLADDYAIGDALRARGYRVCVPPFAIAHVCSQMAGRDLWRHELRWGRTIRTIDPLGYAGSIFGHPLPWALMAMFLGAGSVLLGPAIVLAAAAVGCRIALVKRVEGAFGLGTHPYWLLPLRDLLSFAVFVAGLLGRDVDWRGRRYQVVSGGTLIAEGRSPEP